MKQKKVAILTVFYGKNTVDYFLRYYWAIEKLLKYSKEKVGTEIMVFLLDNSSSPQLSEYIKDNKISLDDKYRVYEEDVNGFASGYNHIARIARKKFRPEFLFILNPDTEVDRHFLMEGLKVFKKERVACLDGKQWPFEHPKEYNEKMETSFCSGACMLTRADLFYKAGGFDEDFFMYAEDVDYSWRMWERGYRCLYEPKAVCVHHCYGPSKGALFRQYWNVRNGYLMRYLHGEISDQKKFIVLCFKSLSLSLKSFSIKEALNISKGIVAGIFISLRKTKRFNVNKRPLLANFNNLYYSGRRNL